MRVEYNNSPSYKALWYNQEFSKAQRAVVKDVMKELNRSDKYFNGKPAIEWLYEKGQELFVSKGSSDKSVKLELVKKVKNPNKIKSVFGGYIGEYSNKKKFNSHDIKDTRHDLVAAPLLFVIASCMILAGMLTGKGSKNPQSVKQNIEQVTKFAGDSLKTLSKDTISFIK